MRRLQVGDRTPGKTFHAQNTSPAHHHDHSGWPKWGILHVQCRANSSQYSSFFSMNWCWVFFLLYRWRGQWFVCLVMCITFVFPLWLCLYFSAGDERGGKEAGSPHPADRGGNGEEGAGGRILRWERERERERERLYSYLIVFLQDWFKLVMSRLWIFLW